MGIVRGQDRCGECGMPLPNEAAGEDPAKRTPCPHCGSTKRVMSLSAHGTATSSASANARLIIGWQEVDRLLAKAEYAAALLVAAVNVEFILWENLRHFTPSAALTNAPHRVRTTWGQIRKNQGKSISLGSLLRVTEFFSNHDKLKLSQKWDPIASVINEARRRIAHERGYFAELTKLKDTDWPEPRIRQVLEDAKAFCHGNAP